MTKSSTHVRRPLLKRPVVRIALGVVAALFAVAVALFEPWTWAITAA